MITRESTCCGNAHHPTLDDTTDAGLRLRLRRVAGVDGVDTLRLLVVPMTRESRGHDREETVLSRFGGGCYKLLVHAELLS